MEAELRDGSVVIVDVEYQSKPTACVHCHTLGHAPIQCPKATYRWLPKKPVQDAMKERVDALDQGSPNFEVANVGEGNSKNAERDSWLHCV